MKQQGPESQSVAISTVGGLQTLGLPFAEAAICCARNLATMSHLVCCLRAFSLCSGSPRSTVCHGKGCCRTSTTLAAVYVHRLSSSTPKAHLRYLLLYGLGLHKYFQYLSARLTAISS